MKSRKAVSHVEMVASFVMFSLFVFFLLIFLNPVRNQNISDVLIDAVERAIESNVSIQLIELPINLKTGVENCFSLPNPFNTSERSNILAKESGGRVLKSSLSGDKLSIEKSLSAESFYYLYFSNVLFETPPLEMIFCTELNASGYNYAASRTNEIFFMQKLTSIKNEYASDYTQLREEFNFPLGYDFSVSITDSTTKQSILSMSTKKPEGVEVNAREVPVEILYGDGNIAKATMNIQVW